MKMSDIGREEVDQIANSAKDPEKKFEENPSRNEQEYYICGIDATLNEKGKPCSSCGLTEEQAKYGNLFSKWKYTGSY